MDCKDAITQANARHDGELESALAGRLDHHLASCAPCRTRVDELSSLRDLIAAEPAVDAPEDLLSRILATPEVAAARRTLLPTGPSLSTRLLAAGLGAIFVFGGWQMLKPAPVTPEHPALSYLRSPQTTLSAGDGSGFGPTGFAPREVLARAENRVLRWAHDRARHPAQGGGRRGR